MLSDGTYHISHQGQNFSSDFSSLPPLLILCNINSGTINNIHVYAISRYNSTISNVYSIHLNLQNIFTVSNYKTRTMCTCNSSLSCKSVSKTWTKINKSNPFFALLFFLLKLTTIKLLKDMERGPGGEGGRARVCFSFQMAPLSSQTKSFK